MTLVETAAVGGLAIIGAGIAEELTHAAAARPFAVSQQVSLTRVRSELPADAPTWIDKWINFAPFFVGLFALLILYLGKGLPPLSRSTVLLYVAWAWFTMPSLTDLQGATGATQPTTEEARARYWVAWRCLTVESVGFLLLLGADELTVWIAGSHYLRTYPFTVSQSIAVYQTVWLTGIGLMFGAVAWLFIDLWLRERAE